MDTTRRITLLSTFIAAGVALAVCLGVTLSPPDPQRAGSAPVSDLQGPAPHDQGLNSPVDAAGNTAGDAVADPPGGVRSGRGTRQAHSATPEDDSRPVSSLGDGGTTGRRTVRLSRPDFNKPEQLRAAMLGSRTPVPVAPHPAYGQSAVEGLLGDQLQQTIQRVEEIYNRGQRNGAGSDSSSAAGPSVGSPFGQTTSSPSGQQLGAPGGDSGGAASVGNAGGLAGAVPGGLTGAGSGNASGGAAGGGATGGVAEIREEGDGELTIHFQNEDIRKVLQLLSAQGNLNILTSPSVQGTVSATLTDVDLETALDAILRSNGYRAQREGKFIYVGTEADFTAIEQSMDEVATRLYRPNYITAAELQKLITPLLTTEVGVASVSSPSDVGMNAEASSAGGDKFAGAEAVVVRDYESVLQQIDQLVDQVDVRPMQIHIEAMILSVALKDDDEYGVNFEFLRNNGNLKFGLGQPAATLADFDFSKGSLKLGFLDESLSTFLSALETIGDTDVIASPRLMVLNKQPAHIQIGDQKGYISTTVTETTATETVEFLETGTILRLRPYISSDGMVRLEIHPELSKGDVKEKGAFTLPEKQVTEVTTNVMVRDGCTVIIGGLMREELSSTKNQVPYVGNLPFVGFVFRSTTEVVQRQEVLVLLTPHIVYEPGPYREGVKAACEFHRRHEVIAEKMEPFNRQHVARRYYRLAQSAWARGDRPTAMRFAEMAVQFNPSSRAAIELRSDIWLGRRVGDHTLADAPTPGPMMGPATDGAMVLPGRPAVSATDMPMLDASTNPATVMDGPELSQWLLDGLERSGSRPAPEPTHPLDPGRPGPRTTIDKPTNF